jgi:hypothetical protein
MTTVKTDVFKYNIDNIEICAAAGCEGGFWSRTHGAGQGAVKQRRGEAGGQRLRARRRSWRIRAASWTRRLVTSRACRTCRAQQPTYPGPPLPSRACAAGFRSRGHRRRPRLPFQCSSAFMHRGARGCTCVRRWYQPDRARWPRWRLPRLSW